MDSAAKRFDDNRPVPEGREGDHPDSRVASGSSPDCLQVAASLRAHVHDQQVRLELLDNLQSLRPLTPLADDLAPGLVTQQHSQTVTQHLVFHKEHNSHNSAHMELAPPTPHNPAQPRTPWDISSAGKHLTLGVLSAEQAEDPNA